MKGAELEGYGYLGLGVIVLLVVALLALFAPGHAAAEPRPYLPLIVITFAAVVVSLSHRVAWGDRVVLEIPIGGKLLETIATLRASGRLLWVAMYGLTFAAAAIVAARFTPQRGDDRHRRRRSRCSSPTSRRATSRCVATSPTASSPLPPSA